MSKPLQRIRPAGSTDGGTAMSAPSIEVLDRMTVNEKLAFFARRDAFKLPIREGEKVARTRRLSRQGLPLNLNPGSIDLVDGHVTRQAYPVIGRPCFGIPTAKLLHGREYKIRMDGSTVFARCGECPIKSACEAICDERLHANAEIWEAYREFRRRGGRDAYWSSDSSRSRGVASALRDLLRHLQSASFSTVADAHIPKHYEAKAAQKRSVNTDRQRKHRKQKLAAPSDAKTVASDRSIADDAVLLHDRIRAARTDTNCPRWLHQIDEALAMRVWAVRTELSRQGKAHGATHIARGLSCVYPASTLDALRKRVETVLKRIDRLERLAARPSNSHS